MIDFIAAKRVRVIWIALAYSVIAVAMTWPVSRYLTTRVAGLGSDTHLIVADVIHNTERLQTLGLLRAVLDTVGGLNVDYISISSFLTAAVGLPLGYNLYWLSSFVVAALGMFLLARSVLDGQRTTARTKHSRTTTIAAFFAGLVYGYAPIHSAWSMGFAGAMHLEWIPLTTWAILRFLRSPRHRNFFLMVLFGIFLIQGEHHFVAFYGLFLIPFVIYYLRRYPSTFHHRLFRRYGLLTILLAGAFALWTYFPLLKIAVSDTNYLNPGLGQVATYSNDLLSPLTPTFLHPVWGDFFSRLRDRFSGNDFEHSAYIGLVVLTLIVFGYVYRRTAELKLWLSIAAGAYILSLGPFLHIAGPIEPNIPLPYLVIRRIIPFLDNVRAINRISVIAFLGLAVVVAISLNYLLDLLRHRHITVIVAPVILTGILLFEYLPVPVPTTSLAYSPFYDQIKKEAGDFTILEIPSATNYRSAARSGYYQARHGRIMLNDFQFSRKNPNDPEYVRNTSVPILETLLYHLPNDASTFSHSAFNILNRKQNTSILNSFGVKYIILHKGYTGRAKDEIAPADFPKIIEFIETRIDTQRQYEDDSLIAFAVQPGREPATIVTTTDEWEIPKDVDGTTFQWIQPRSTLQLTPIDPPTAVFLTFTAMATKGNARLVTVATANEEIETFAIDDKPRVYRVPVMSLPAGPTNISLVVRDINGQVINASSATTVGLAAIEAIPFPTATLTAYETILEQRPTGAILQIPFQGRFAADHDRLIEPGDYFHPSVSPQSPFDRSAPLAREIVFGQQFTAKDLTAHHDIIDLTYYQSILRAEVERQDISTVIVHRDQLTDDERQAVTTWLTELLPFTVAESIGGLDVYHRRADVRAPNVIPIRVTGAWDVLERYGTAEQIRKLSTSSGFVIENTQSTSQAVDFVAELRACPQTQQRLLWRTDNGQEQIIDAHWTDYTTQAFPLELHPGRNEILLQSVDETGHTRTGDQVKKCGIWFRNVRIE